MGRAQGSDESPEDRKRKGKRWAFDFAPKGPAKIRAWTEALRRALNAGRVDVQVEERKGSAVLVWPAAVTFYSAYRIHQKAREHDSSFATLGLPRCVDGAADGAESATELAPEPGAALAPEPGAAPVKNEASGGGPTCAPKNDPQQVEQPSPEEPKKRA